MAVLKKTADALIAQLDRASGYGPEGREFESSSARQNRCELLGLQRFFVYFKFSGGYNYDLYRDSKSGA